MADRSVIGTAEADRQFLAQFQELAADRPSRVVDLVLSGLRIRVTWCDELGASFSDPLSHALEPPHGQPDATIIAVSGRPRSGSLGRPPWGADDYLPRAEVRGRTEGPIRVAFNVDVGTLAMVDLDRSTGVWWCADPGALPSWERGAPLRFPVHWLLAAHDVRLVHGAVVGDESGAVLIAGEGGTGKSTSTIAALADGMRTTGDDYVLVDLRTPGDPVSVALYDMGKLGPFGLAAFPQVAEHGRGVVTEQGKELVSLSAAFPSGFVERLPLRAIVTPRLAERTGAPVPTSRAAALRALGPSTLVQLPADDERALRQMGDLVRSVPAYALDIGPDLNRVPGALRQAIDEAVA